jgi:2-polyprenyl-3-methyl-5-hydroxy-6-metoxy-1,4-benzoquinol methylase
MSSLEQERIQTNIKQKQRASHGFIPDLKNMTDCDYFYLSPFRRRYTANLSLRPYVDFSISALNKHYNVSRILDIGCGTGWYPLELARKGFDVTAIDLADYNIELAKDTYNKALENEKLGRIEHVAGDFALYDFGERKFDCITSIGAFHHMENIEDVITKVKSLLNPEGLIISIEPVPENITNLEAAVIALIRIILSSTDCWYEDVGPFNDINEIESYAEECKLEYQNWADKTELGNQSPMNNATSGKDVLVCLRKYFKEISYEDSYLWSQRIIGGIRSSTEDKNIEITKLITLLDRYFVEKKLVNPMAYLWCGQSI